MKKVMVLLLTTALMIAIIQPGINTQAAIPKLTIYVDNELVTFDTEPIIREGRTLVPIRGIFEKLGATVDWNKETNQVVVKDEVMELLLAVGNSAVLVNGRIEFLDTQSMIIDGRTLVPLRFIAETLGYDVSWDGDLRRIDIRTVDSPVVIEAELPKVESKEALVQLLEYSRTLNEYIDYRFFWGDMFWNDAFIEDEEFMEMMMEEEQNLPDSVMESDDSSGTNNQVEGVEEGDITKTDGTYIYYTSDNKVKIIDANPENPQVVSTIEVDSERGYISDIYIRDKQIIILGTSYTHYAYPEEMLVSDDMSILPYYDAVNTFVLVYDLEDITQPINVMDMDYEGSLVSSRLIDDKLYLVTNKYINRYTLDQIQTEFDEYALKPKYSNNVDGEVVTIEYDEIYYFPNYIEPNFIMTVGVDLATRETDVQSYLGSAENVYASMDSMYLTFTNYEYTEAGEGLIYMPNYEVNTSIYKFSLLDGIITYETESKVEGTVVNQFSLDEHNGNLRIATTKGDMWNTSNPSVNNVYILDETLTTIGELTGLAEGEKIYSTRFAGERIYMVTFRQVDPFFVIDATDPTKPEVLGELKIPGFSTYMHILDADHVLGFGKDTIDQGGFVTTGGFKIALFDVTDPTNPTEKKKEIIGTTGTYSELENNHKALMISLSKGIMGFPISVASETPYSVDFRGAYIYDVSTNDFTFRGTITHISDDLEKYQTPTIQRIIYIGDYLYTLSNGMMKITRIDSMEFINELEF